LKEIHNKEKQQARPQLLAPYSMGADMGAFRKEKEKYQIKNQALAREMDQRRVGKP